MLKLLSSKLNLQKNEWILPVIAFLVAFALRKYFMMIYQHPMMIHEQDAMGYMDAAKSILHLQFPSLHGRPPGYPVVIALFALLPVDLEDAARLASIFMDALIVVPLFYIARIYLSRLESLAVCLLWASFSFSLFFSPSPLSQSSYLCYLLFGILFLHLGLKNKEKWWLFAAGTLMALSYLARPEGIVGFACGMLICVTTFFEKGSLNKKNLLMVIYFLFGFLLLAGPFLIALHSVLGSWTLSAVGEAQLKGVESALKLNSNGELYKTGTAGMYSIWVEYYKTLSEFSNVLWTNIQKFSDVYLKEFPVWIHLVSGFGFFALVWQNPWRKSFFSLILIAVLVPSFVVNIPKVHSYIYPLFALTFICFVYCFSAIDKIISWMSEKYYPVIKPLFRQIIMASILFAITFYNALVFIKKAHGGFQSPQYAMESMITEKIYKNAGEIIKSNSGANDIIMTRWGLVGYFADRRVLTLPKGGVKEVIEYGRKGGARFILIDSKAVLSRRQELFELLDPLYGKPLNPEYGIEAFYKNYFPGLGGYVLYKYK